MRRRRPTTPPQPHLPILDPIEVNIIRLALQDRIAKHGIDTPAGIAASRLFDRITS